MRLLSTMVVAIAVQVLSGCAANTVHPQQPVQLKALAEQISSRWPVASPEIKMNMSWTSAGILHCRLTNTSSHSLDLNESSFPWNIPRLIGVAVLNGEGEVVFSNENQVVNMLVPAPRLRVVMPADSVESDFPLARYPALDGVLGHEDQLMVWHHFIEIYLGQDLRDVHIGKGLSVSGITFIPKRLSRQ